MHRDNPDLLRKIDAVARHRALVFGSLPPEGRDLDLLVVPDDAAAIVARLRGDGFTAWGRRWVSFTGCSVDIVELIPAMTLRVPPAELEAVFAEATPLQGLTHVVEPSPHHTLLILATKLAHEPWRLAPKHRARIDRAVARDPAVWEAARHKARLWRAQEALTRLESAYVDPEAGGWFHWRLILRRPRRTRAIALSGADVDLVRSHAESLREILDRLGFDAVVERPHPPRLKTHRLTARTPESASGAGAHENGILSPVLAIATVLSLWRPVWRELGRGKVLIYENSALDFALSLSDAGAPPAKRRPSARFLRFLSPRPLRSYLLDPERSHEGLCEEIAADAWRALTRRTAFGLAVRKVRRIVRGRRSPDADRRPS